MKKYLDKLSGDIQSLQEQFNNAIRIYERFPDTRFSGKRLFSKLAIREVTRANIYVDDETCRVYVRPYLKTYGVDIYADVSPIVIGQQDEDFRCVDPCYDWQEKLIDAGFHQAIIEEVAKYLVEHRNDQR